MTKLTAFQKRVNDAKLKANGFISPEEKAKIRAVHRQQLEQSQLSSVHILNVPKGNIHDGTYDNRIFTNPKTGNVINLNFEHHKELKGRANFYNVKDQYVLIMMHFNIVYRSSQILNAIDNLQ